jgi:hypothetical protein
MLMRSLLILLALSIAAPAMAAPTTRPATRPVALEAGKLSIHLKDAHPKAVFAELANLVGANFRPSPAGLWEGKEWPTVSIELQDVSFWKALRAISEKTGLYIQRGAVERNYFVVNEPGAGKLWTTYPTSENGPFLFSLQSLDRVHRSDLMAGETSRQVNVRMILYTEPKLRVLKVAQQTNVTAAVDELGNKLSPAPNPGAQAMGGTWGWWLTGRIALPENVGERIARLRGFARITVQMRSEVVEVPDITTAENVERTVAGHKLVVKNVRARGETYTVSMTITRDPKKPGGWGEINLSSTFRLLDANGVPLSRRNYGGGTNLGDYTELNLMFGRDDWNGEGAGPPAKLIWEVPTETAVVEAPFEFEDVPMPW